MSRIMLFKQNTMTFSRNLVNCIVCNHKNGLSTTLIRNPIHPFSVRRGIALETHRRKHFPLATPTCRLSSAADVQKPLPTEAEVVVCGGGVVGASVALHLKMLGWRNVVLLEQGKLTCGTTWHSVGLIGRVRGGSVESAISCYSRDLYKQLEQEGYPTGWKQCGSVYLARTQNRLIQYKRALYLSELEGVEGGRVISGDEVKNMIPFLKTDDIEGAVYSPGDGVVSAPDAAIAMTSKAKDMGVHVREGIQVTRVVAEGDQVRAVETNHGDIQCQVFVNTAGMWARDLGQKCTTPINIPLHACEHFYIVTKAMEGVDRMTPVVRDYDGHIYLREWSGGLLVGGFEPVAKPIFSDGVPAGFEFQLLPEDWEHFQIFMDEMLHRVPMLGTAEIKSFVNGPESFTPDSKYILGEAPEVKNYFVAAGMNSSGVAGAGGVGKYLAEWITDGRPSRDLSHLDIRRFVGLHSGKGFLRERVKETLGSHDKAQPPVPQHCYESGRFMIPSPLYEPMKQQGALFEQQTNLHERPAWFETRGKCIAKMEQKNAFVKPVWFDNVHAEYKACRSGVGLIDMSALTKFEISSAGSEAEQFLQYICSNNVVPDESRVGTIVHSGILNEHGGYENDCSIVRLDQNRFLMIGHTSQQTRNISWLTQHLPKDGSVHLRDTTSAYVALNLIGPMTEKLMEDLTGLQLNKTNFPSLTCQEIRITDSAGIQAMRMTLSEEDGWILYVPKELSLQVYNKLIDAGQVYGMRNTGYYALQALRCENASVWSTQPNAHTTPLECGRERHIKWELGGFIGHEALIKQKKEGVTKKLIQLTIEDHNAETDVWPWGSEPIYRNGQVCGSTGTIAYGFTAKKLLCYGYLQNIDPETKGKKYINNEFITKGTQFEVNIAGTFYPASVQALHL